MSALMGKKVDDIPDIDLENLDDLLEALTTEELEELNGDFDPDVSVLPCNSLCEWKTFPVSALWS